MTQEQDDRSDVFDVNFEHIQHTMNYMNTFIYSPF